MFSNPATSFAPPPMLGLLASFSSSSIGQAAGIQYESSSLQEPHDTYHHFGQQAPTWNGLHNYALPRFAPQPARSLFQDYIFLDPRRIPVILGALYAATTPVLEGQKQTDARVLEAFVKAIQEKITRRTDKGGIIAIADLAHQIYCKQLSEGERIPKQYVFRDYVSGERKNSDILALLKAAGIKLWSRLHYGHVLMSFQMAVEEHKRETLARSIGHYAIANFAHQIYCRNLAEGISPPSRFAFYYYLKDPDVSNLLRSAGIQNQKVRVGLQRALEAFQSAIQENEETIRSGRMSLTAIADRAHRIYCKGLPEGEPRTSQGTFRHCVRDLQKFPEVAALLDKAGVQKRQKIGTDRQQVVEAFRKAIEENEESIRSGKMSPTAIAGRAHQIYCKGLPKGSRPSHGTFLAYVHRNHEIAALLDAAGARRRG